FCSSIFALPSPPAACAPSPSPLRPPRPRPGGAGARTEHAAAAPMAATEPRVDVPRGDAEAGAKLFKAQCARCHTIGKGGCAKAGPPLWGLLGRRAGALEGYAFSEAAGRPPPPGGGGGRRGGRPGDDQGWSAGPRARPPP
ncbi:unnamed protein product, partial [Prorocentrum cordatum]